MPKASLKFNCPKDASQYSIHPQANGLYYYTVPSIGSNGPFDQLIAIVRPEDNFLWVHLAFRG